MEAAALRVPRGLVTGELLLERIDLALELHLVLVELLDEALIGLEGDAETGELALELAGALLRRLQGALRLLEVLAEAGDLFGARLGALALGAHPRGGDLKVALSGVELGRRLVVLGLHLIALTADLIEALAELGDRLLQHPLLTIVLHLDIFHGGSALTADQQGQHDGSGEQILHDEAVPRCPSGGHWFTKGPTEDDPSQSTMGF